MIFGKMLQIKNVPRPSFGGVARNPLLSLGRLHKAYFDDGPYEPMVVKIRVFS